MRKIVVLFLLLGWGLGRPLAAQPLASRPRPQVPATLDVAGLHLVLNEAAQQLVQQKADGLVRHQPSFQARVDLADAAFPIIDRVLKAEGVPLDFRYLALQESALQGDARSAHEAVGYWQLKQETATGLGLVVNDAVDERQHLAASTRAAARYLSRNNAKLHNWLNALLSYYTGLSGVMPYTLPTHADATEMAITEATSPYLLMFLAQKVTFETACGLNPNPPLRLLEFPALAGQSLQAQAQLLRVDPAALAVHNHWLLAAAVPTDRPYTLIVPVSDITQAATILANQRLQSSQELLTMPEVADNPAEVRVNDLRALVALPGETTADLARRGHKGLRDFLHDNELTPFDAVVPGRPYYLESKRDAAAVEYHVVQPGETVFDVAQKYGIRKKAIMSKNRMFLPEELRPGRVLWLQHVRPREVAVEYRTLSEGARLERVAKAPRRPSPEAVAGTGEPVLVTPGRRQAAARRGRRESAKAERAKAAAQDGWGEALPAPSTPAQASQSPEPAPTPVSTPVRPVAPAPEVVAELSPPAPVPPSSPLADEPREPEPSQPELAAEPLPEPVVSRPAVTVSKPAPVKSEPAPVKSEPVPATPRSVAVAPKPAAAPAPVPVTPGPVTPGPSTNGSPTGAVVPATHRVARGETVYAIGRRYQIPPATLLAINQLAPSANLSVGQVLLLQAPSLPPVAAARPPAPTPVARPIASPAAAGTNPALYVPQKTASPVATGPTAAISAAIQHTVAIGETLYSISRRYGVTVADLQAWNGKQDATAKLGEVLRVFAAQK
ncbi:LysM peptidoglycan-binding domain-containing protein [Hymenobacter sp. BT664]|uniref:LysM peptidoglycan-binding domain-containing protein n=1 Tax=Hymenobacter montanus TaxID=2771359 RepID=A0A927GIS2_9BACT|nr:LysM peptidoglycan-binding domain-containing protein [Hymenobacter montanus]MBD2767381.1 LysM peptidoglycan-binding domain-containing protein [Hymenobacter montanus]